jgi:hypothetical protein
LHYPRERRRSHQPDEQARVQAVSRDSRNHLAGAAD